MNPATTPKTTPSSGLLLLDKRAGMTSFDCIRELKRAWKRTDLGHGGTLDKFATGLLPIFAGEGLKLARFFLESFPTLPTYWKSYEGVFELGTATETGDPEGAVIEKSEPRGLSLERVAEVLRSFEGQTYDQLPPRYSAKKIGGTRASDLVREGREPELKAVPVHIRRFRCLGLEGTRARFEVECSKGTYVRSLAVDLARKLDTVAYVSELRRTSVGGFVVARALPLEVAAARAPEEALLDLGAATAFLPPFELLGVELEQLRVGRTDSVAARLANSGLSAGVYCAQTQAGPVALFELTPEKQARFLRAFVQNVDG